MASSSLGFRIEWTSVFREQSGVVVRVISNDELCVLDDLMGEECRLKTTTPFILRGPALQQFIDYHTKDIPTIAEKKAQILELFTEYFSANTWSAAKKEILARLVEEDSKTKADEKEGEPEEEEGDEDEADLDDSEEEEEEEDESDKDDDDDDEEEEDDESEEDDDTSGDDDDDEGTIVDLKIYMKDTDEVRGFSVSSTNGFAVIHKQLTDDYGTAPKLYYRDEESDNVALLAQSDFQYAGRLHIAVVTSHTHFDDTSSYPLITLGQHPFIHCFLISSYIISLTHYHYLFTSLLLVHVACTSVRIHRQTDNKSKRGKNNKNIPLKLIAEFPTIASTARVYSLNMHNSGSGLDTIQNFDEKETIFSGDDEGNGGDGVGGGGKGRGTRMSMRHQQQQQQQQQSFLYRGDRERIHTPNPLFPFTTQSTGFGYSQGLGQGQGLADRGQGLASQGHVLYGDGSGKGMSRQQSCEILWQQG